MRLKVEDYVQRKVDTKIDEQIVVIVYMFTLSWVRVGSGTCYHIWTLYTYSYGV